MAKKLTVTHYDIFGGSTKVKLKPTVTNNRYAWQKVSETAVHVMGLGAGRQSSAMYLLALNGVITPRPTAAIFSDTENEPLWVYEQLDFLMQVNESMPEKEQIPIFVVSAGDIFTESLASATEHTRWDGPPMFVGGSKNQSRRTCTRKYKIEPKERESRQLMKHECKTHLVDWRGHTTDEEHQAKQDDRLYWWNRWTLLELDMSNEDCAKWAWENYQVEFSWSACRVCPYVMRDPVRLLELKEKDPDGFQQAVELDSAARWIPGMNNETYLHPQRIPLSMVDVEGDAETAVSQPLFDGDVVGYDGLDRCDSGECGL